MHESHTISLSYDPCLSWSQSSFCVGHVMAVSMLFNMTEFPLLLLTSLKILTLLNKISIQSKIIEPPQVCPI